VRQRRAQRDGRQQRRLRLRVTPQHLQALEQCVENNRTELFVSTQRDISVTQRALSVTQRARSVTHRALSVPQRALSVTQRARSVTQLALSVIQRALSVTQRALSVTQRALSVTQRARSVTQRELLDVSHLQRRAQVAVRVRVHRVDGHGAPQQRHGVARVAQPQQAAAQQTSDFAATDLIPKRLGLG
jgi:hypothetical protein